MSENHSRKLTAVVFEGVEKSMSLREPGFGVQVRMRKVWSIRNHEVVWS